MKILFATKNPAKIDFYATELAKKGYEVLTLNDLPEEIEIIENGKDCIENAMIKAKTCYDKTKITTIGIDDNLFIEGLSEEQQPKNHVRRVNGKYLSDDEMIEHYTKVANDLGGKANAYWLHGIAICKNGDTKTFEKRSDMMITNTISKVRHEGYPLDSICMNLKTGKYQSELTKEEIEQGKQTKNKAIFDFLIRKHRGVSDMEYTYLEEVNQTVRDYFEILSDEFPEFLYDYIETPEMRRLRGTSIGCGTDWSNLFHHKFFHSNLEHSVGVALIVWHFTKSKKQTLAGLFHDIATPSFKHCIDFMNGDAKTQESTEEETEEIIRNSKEIMDLLKRDGITVEEVKDYHIYPIADNDTPKLSSDRLEYTFMNGIMFKEVWDLAKIKQIYEDIEILTNEEGMSELGFKTKEIAEEFIEKASKLWPLWISKEDKITMQFFADVLKELSQKQIITKRDLYTYSEQEIIEKIKHCGDKRIQEAFQKFQNATKVYESDEKIEENYCISIDAKKRYIIPLVKNEEETVRINKISSQAKKQIEDFLKWNTKKYIYFDFNF